MRKFTAVPSQNVICSEKIDASWEEGGVTFYDDPKEYIMYCLDNHLLSYRSVLQAFIDCCSTEDATSVLEYLNLI